MPFRYQFCVDFFIAGLCKREGVIGERRLANVLERKGWLNDPHYKKDELYLAYHDGFTSVVLGYNGVYCNSVVYVFYLTVLLFFYYIHLHFWIKNIAWVHVICFSSRFMWFSSHVCYLDGKYGGKSLGTIFYFLGAPI